MTEFLAELREHWDDPYWWADHQFEAIVLATVLAGVINLAFVYLEMRMRQRMRLAP